MGPIGHRQSHSLRRVVKPVSASMRSPVLPVASCTVRTGHAIGDVGRFEVVAGARSPCPSGALAMGAPVAAWAAFWMKFAAAVNHSR